MSSQIEQVLAAWRDRAILFEQEVGKAVVGLDGAIRQITIGIFSRGHIMLEGDVGVGKTTLLRMLAGLEIPDAGRILIDGQDMTSTPAHLRPVNMMFQSYALFPHMDVAANVGYGLRREGVAGPEIAARVREALALVQLEGLEMRRPAQLSGGQRQRVALARALIKRPKLLLLDEPLGALDRKLREEMQIELKLLQSRLGITFVFVTHDRAFLRRQCRNHRVQQRQTNRRTPATQQHATRQMFLKWWHNA